MTQSTKSIDQKNDDSLTKNLTLKTKYLERIKRALATHNDLLVYKLLDTRKYVQVMKKKRYDNSYNYKALIKDLFPRLSHHLSHRLIVYLKKMYPFFYYHENQLGHYQIYFGDWWGHKLFGTLDVLNVEFNFDSTEYGKLKRSFVSKQGINKENISQLGRKNTQLKKLIATQNTRKTKETELKAALKSNQSQARMPWNTSRIKANYSMITSKLKKYTRQDKLADNAKAKIQHNQKQSLEFSKENTVIDYEKRCIKKYFGDLSQFNESNHQLYYNYVSNLLAGGKN